MKANDKIKVHFYSGRTAKLIKGAEFKTRHADTIFTVYEKHGKLGIDWNTECSPYINNGDIFSPLATFAPTVEFENIETGKRYYYDQTTRKIQEV